MFLKNITRELRGMSSEIKSLNDKFDKLIEVQTNKEKDLILAVTKLAEAVEQSTFTAKEQFSTAQEQFSNLVNLSSDFMEELMADDISEDFFTEEEEAHRQLAEELSNLLGDDSSTDDEDDAQSTPADESSEIPDHNLLDLPDETDLRQFAEPLLNDGFVTSPVEESYDGDGDEESSDEEDPEEDESFSDLTITVGRSYLLNYYVNQIPDLARAIYPDKTGSDFSIFLEALGKVDLNLLGDYIANTEDNFTAMSDFYEIRYTDIFKEAARKVTVEMVKALKSETEVPESPYTVLPVQEAIEDFFLMAVKFLNGILIERTQAVNAYRLSNEVLRSYVS